MRKIEKRKNRAEKCIFILVCLFISACHIPVAAHGEQEINDDAGAGIIDTNSVSMEEPDIDPVKIEAILGEIAQTRKEAITNLEKHLGVWPDADPDGSLRLLLAGLYQEEATEEYEREFELYDQGVMVEPPVLEYDPSIKLYQTLLDGFPDAPITDRILYHLGYCLSANGENETAIDSWTSLGQDYPESEYAAEAWMRVGEILFDDYRFDEAADAYRQVLSYWDSIYFDKALYKLGWVSYLIDEYDDAISYFIFLLNENEKNEAEEGEVSRERNRLGLEQEALEYAALSFIEHGGVGTFRIFNENSDEYPYLPDILVKMGEFYEKREWFEAAIEAYDSHAELYPLHLSGPKVRLSSIRAHEQIEDFEGSMISREALALQFGAGSEWAEVNGDSKEAEGMLQFAAGSLYDAAKYFHREGKQAGDEATCLRALDDYQILLDAYPTFDKRVEAIYAMADCYFTVDMFTDAGRQYMTVARAEEQTDSLRSLAALNGIASAEQSLENAPEDADSLARETLMDYCFYYIGHFPESDKTPLIRYKRGELYFAAGEFDSAGTDFSTVKDCENEELSAKAVRMLARSRYQVEDYTGAEIWFRSAADYSSGETRTEMENMALVSLYKQADVLKSADRLQDAAQVYEKIAKVQTDQTEAVDALFEAATLYSTVSESLTVSYPDSAANISTRAAETFESLASLYPASEFAPKALYNAAYLREGREEFLLAAENYRNISKKYSGSEYADNAAFLYASNLEKGGMGEEAFQAFRTYAKTRQDPHRRLSSYLKMVQGFSERGKPSKTNYYVIQTYKLDKECKEKGIELDQAALSEIFFAGATITSKRFEEVELKQPLNKNLKKKKQLLDTLIRECLGTAALKVAPWTFAATYRMGEAFEHYYNALINAELPSNLSPVEQDIYIIELEEAAEPFVNKAVQAYSAVCRQSSELGIESEWPDKALIRLEILDPSIHEETVALMERSSGDAGVEDEREPAAESVEDQLASLTPEDESLSIVETLESIPGHVDETESHVVSEDNHTGSPQPSFTEILRQHDSKLLYGGIGTGAISVMAFVAVDNGTTIGVASGLISAALLGTWSYFNFVENESENLGASTIPSDKKYILTASGPGIWSGKPGLGFNIFFRGL